MKEEGDVGAMIRDMGVPVFSMRPRRKLSWMPGIKKVARIVREHRNIRCQSPLVDTGVII